MIKRQKPVCTGILLIILSVFVTGCIFSSGTDKKDKGPGIVSVSISDGELFKTRDITISWQGNKEAEFFQYTIDDVMYDWTESTSVELTDLEESEHIFTLQARKDSVFSSLTTVSFIIDAIQGPGIVFSPRKISTTSYVTVKLEDVIDLMAAHIEIISDDGSARFGEFTHIDPIMENVSLVCFYDRSDPARLIIDIGFAGAPRGVNGSFDIGSFLVGPLKNTGIIKVDSEKTVFRDIGNQSVVINGFDMVRIKR